MKSRGYVLTQDALVALAIVIIATVGLMSFNYSRSYRSREAGFTQVHLRSEDVIEVLNKEGKLDEIGILWSNSNFSNETDIRADNIVGASAEARDSLNPLIPTTAGYRLEIAGEVVYDSDWDSGNVRKMEADSVDKTRSVRLVSGVSQEEGGDGWVGRAFLVGNLTFIIDELEYDGQDLKIVVMPLRDEYDGDHTEMAYLVAPQTARLFDGKMNLTWDSDAWPECPEYNYSADT